MSKRNGFVELMRFVFAIMVVGYHIGNYGLVNTAPIFNYGFYAVEFFFILSGFCSQNPLKNKGKTIVGTFCKKQATLCGRN